MPYKSKISFEENAEENSWAYSLPMKYLEIFGNPLYSLPTPMLKNSRGNIGSQFISATAGSKNSSILSDVHAGTLLLPTIWINIHPLGYIMTFNCKITLVRFVDIIASCIVVIVV